MRKLVAVMSFLLATGCALHAGIDAELFHHPATAQHEADAYAEAVRAIKAGGATPNEADIELNLRRGGLSADEAVRVYKKALADVKCCTQSTSSTE